jgi:hypothetical protein
MPDTKIFEVNVTLLHNTISGMEVTGPGIGGGNHRKSKNNHKKHIMRKRNTKRKST